MNHRLRLELIWKQKCSAVQMKLMSVCGKHKSESHGSRDSQRIEMLHPSLFSVPFIPLLKWDAREKLVVIKRIAVFLKLTAVYTSIIHKQTWTANATSSSFWRLSPKNAAEELRNVITHRNIYVQLLVHTENAKHNILLIAWCLRVQINMPGFSTTPRSDRQHVLIGLYS